MVYYHVLHTGDKSFLHKKVGYKTIADWMIFHALVGDNLSKPVQLNYFVGTPVSVYSYLYHESAVMVKL